MLEASRESRDGLKAALGRPQVTAAVDLGASKVACFIMKPDGVRRVDRTLTASGVAHVQSRGVRNGAIINIDEASEAVAQAVERAESMAEVRVQGVTVTTSGGQIAVELDQLYGYVVRKLTLSNIRNDDQGLMECVQLLTPIQDAWAGIRPAVGSGRPQ